MVTPGTSTTTTRLFSPVMDSVAARGASMVMWVKRLACARRIISLYTPSSSTRIVCRGWTAFNACWMVRNRPPSFGSFETVNTFGSSGSAGFASCFASAAGVTGFSLPPVPADWSGVRNQPGQLTASKAVRATDVKAIAQGTSRTRR